MKIGSFLFVTDVDNSTCLGYNGVQVEKSTILGAENKQQKGDREMIQRFERFTLAISELYRYWHKIAADEMARYQLKGPHALYLVALHRYEQGITAAGLCEVCGRNKADVSRAVALLEERGLVVREGDQYRAQLKLTEVGKQAAEQVRERARMAVEIGGRGLTEEQRTAFYETLTVIAANLKTISQLGIPEEE